MKRAIGVVCILVFLACCKNKKSTEKSAVIDSSLNDHPLAADTSHAQASMDTSFNDLSNRFKVTIPAFPDTTLSAVEGLSVAVIPVDAIGAVKIPWSDNQQQLSKETEKEFETELLECKDGKDKNDETGAVTKMKKGYCERTGYGDAGMGHFGVIYYCSFKKDNNLVVIEMMTYWSNCATGYETKSEIKACEAERDKQEKAIDSYVESLVASLKIKRI